MGQLEIKLLWICMRKFYVNIVSIFLGLEWLDHIVGMPLSSPIVSLFQDQPWFSVSYLNPELANVPSGKAAELRTSLQSSFYFRILAPVVLIALVALTWIYVLSNFSNLSVSSCFELQRSRMIHFTFLNNVLFKYMLLKYRSQWTFVY